VDWEHAMHSAIDSEIIQEPYSRISSASVDDRVRCEKGEDDMLSGDSGDGIAAAVVDGRHNPDDNTFTASQAETEVRDERDNTNACFPTLLFYPPVGLHIVEQTSQNLLTIRRELLPDVLIMKMRSMRTIKRPFLYLVLIMKLVVLGFYLW